MQFKLTKVSEILHDMMMAKQRQRKQPDDKFDAYLMACSLSQEYVNEMKLPCLRAVQNYDCYEAANLLVRFFHRKLQLFGLPCLVKDITQDDLNEDEQDILRQGLVQLLSYRDAAGRAVLFMDGLVNIRCESTKSAVSSFLYALW